MNILWPAYVLYMFAVTAQSIHRGHARALLAHLKYQALLLGAFVMIVPFYWMLITSLKGANEAMAYPPQWWPARPLWGNYAEAWFKPDVAYDGTVFGLERLLKGFGLYYWVSLYSGFLTTVGTLFTSILAAYAFSHMEFWGKNLFFYVVLATMMVPGQVLIIPNFIILAKLNWLDTYKALVVPWLASVFSIFLIRQFFMTLPNDLWDASQIDGAGRWRFLWRVLIPLSKPVLITSALFTFINQWNSLLWPLVVTSRPEMRTLMVGLQVFTNDSGSDFHLLMAASTFSVLPIVIVFFFVQRFFIEGIARSGLK